MHIYENGAILRSSKSDVEIDVMVLVADIFELNTDLKAMVVVDVDRFSYDFTDDSKTLDYMKAISECDIFECDATAMGHNFRCVFEDCTIDTDYGNGSIVRFYLFVEDYDSHKIKVEPESNFDKMKEILNDESLYCTDINDITEQEKKDIDLAIKMLKSGNS